LTINDLMPFAGTIGGGFFIGLLAGYAIKKIIKIAAVIVGLFVAALAYLEYHRIIQVDWGKLQTLSQSGITWLANAVTHISNNIGASYTGALPNFGIPLAASASAGFALGMV
jgi:uncharacterized membrane protein (Fun14 family)